MTLKTRLYWMRLFWKLKTLLLWLVLVALAVMIWNFFTTFQTGR